MRLSTVSITAITLAIATAGCGTSSESPGVATGGTAGSSGAGATGGGGTGATAGTGATGGSAGTGGSSGGSGGSGGVIMQECPPDADGDNIPDDIEGKASDLDTDGDGTPDYLDEDSDNDTIPDLLEAKTGLTGCNVPLDSDSDGTPNHQDTDSDNNGLDDRDEITLDGNAYDPSVGLSDVDGDTIEDVFDADNDNDDLDDIDEITAGNTSDVDGDGLPGHADPDSDNDTIGDGFEDLEDFDGDGKLNLVDLDSDADGVEDHCEAGQPHQLTDPPADSDADGKFDFLDPDSDNDGLRDGIEDADQNCTVNVGETDRTKADTDGDGASDNIELSLGSDPGNAQETPQSIGKYYFEIPYNEAPIPTMQDIVLKTTINKGDIGFVVDTTGTMAPAIANINASFTNIINEVKNFVDDARFGLIGYEDLPTSPYGVASDTAVYVPGNAYLSSNTAQISNAIAQIQTGDGADVPEAGILGMYRAIKNNPLIWGQQIAPFSPPSGGYGGLGFRANALGMLVVVTDAPFHNGKRVGESAIHDPYTAWPALPDADDVIAEMNSAGIRMVGVALNGGGSLRTNAPYPDMAHIVDNTNSYVLPTAIGPTTQCPTDISGGLVQVDGPDLGPGLPSCRLIFASSVDGSTAGATVSKGLGALLGGLRIEMRLRAIPNQNAPYLPVDAIDKFIDYIEVYRPGNVSDPSEPGKFCALIPLIDTLDNWADKYGVTPGPDLYRETVKNLQPGKRVCFRIQAKANTEYPQTDDIQIASATLRILAKNEGQTVELNLGEPREVLFIIPPNAQ